MTNSMVLPLLVVFLMNAYSVFADDSMKGLRRLTVAVEELDADFAASAFSTVTLQTDLELKLRKFGMEIAPRKTVGSPCLYLRLSTMDIHDGEWTYSIALKFISPVKVLYNDQLALADLWTKSSHGVVGKRRVHDLRDLIGDKVDQFINEWLKANPTMR
jgi:hypothetical protein